MSNVLEMEEVLREELSEIERRRLAAEPAPATPLNSKDETQTEGETQTARASRLDLSALCLSGGGIRSAAFCLGVVQAMARGKLLNEFDYVSSVSGGGYISGWLQMLLRDECPLDQQPGTPANGQHSDGAAPAVQHPPPAAPKTVDDVLRELGEGKIPALRRLRGFTSFLTPQASPVSADVWAGITLYLRNLFLNWMVFLPALLLVGLAPIIYCTLVRQFAAFAHTAPTQWALVWPLALGTVCLTGATWQACTLLPSHRGDPAKFATPRQILWRVIVPALVWAYMIPPVLDYEYYATHQAMLTLDTFRVANPGNPYNLWLDLRKLLIPLLYLLAVLGGYRLAWWQAASHDELAQNLYRKNRWRWRTASLFSATLIWAGILLASTDNPLYHLATGEWGDIYLLVNSETALSVAVPIWLIGMHVMQTTFYVALRKQGRLAELDREWLARLNGLVLRTGLACATVAFCCLVLPQWLALVAADGQWNHDRLSGTAGAATALGAALAWFGKRLEAPLETVANDPGKWRGWITSPWILNGFCLVFAVLLLAFAGGIMQHILGWLQQSVNAMASAGAGTPTPPSEQASAMLGHLVQQHRTLECLRSVTDPAFLLPTALHPCKFPHWLLSGLNYLAQIRHMQLVSPSPDNFMLPLVLQAVTVVMLLVPLRVFSHINVNRFSMHAVYRNRLVRAFLGTARNQRNPDDFTGFDLTGRNNDDNPRLQIFSEVPSSQCLFPIINTTLNMTVDTNTAWAERKAACFTATPLHCGSAALRHSNQRPDDPPIGAFARTSNYAGKEGRHDQEGEGEGVTLGTMMTISGAAISPNWGYHSSPATAFVMTLFNVRLGAWLPNPAKATPEAMQLAKPKNSLVALFSELLGETKDTSQAIYLSDGGHFENLGMYEMLRRRCRLLLVVDAGQDEDCKLFDLGNAIRKAAIDFNIRITMPKMRIYSRTSMEKNEPDTRDALGFAVGTIEYPPEPKDGPDATDQDKQGPVGHFIYLKPSWLPGIPADVRAYGLSNPSFPHVSTVDQWFTESEFESYRALGEWQMGQLITPQVPDLNALFMHAAWLAKKQP